LRLRGVDSGNADAFAALQPEGIAVNHKVDTPIVGRRGGDQQQRRAGGQRAEDDHRHGGGLYRLSRRTRNPGLSSSAMPTAMSAASPCVPRTVDPVMRRYVRAVLD